MQGKYQEAGRTNSDGQDTRQQRGSGPKTNKKDDDRKSGNKGLVNGGGNNS